MAAKDLHLQIGEMKMNIKTNKERKLNVIYISDFEEFKNRKSTKELYDKYGLKREFIKQMMKVADPESAKNAFYALARCAKKEEREQEDMCLFNENQMDEMLREIGYTSITAVSSDMSRFTSYLDFCIQRGAIPIGYNLLREMPLFRFENFKNYINIYRTIETHFSHERVDGILKNLRNAQDQAVIMLLAEGIKGKEMCEIINLKIGDIDVKYNTLTLKNTEGEFARKREVSEKTIKMLLAAHKQKEYLLRNGESSRRSELWGGDWIIRSAGARAKSAKITKVAIDTRIRVLKDILGIGGFLSSNIYESSIVNKTIDIIEKKRIRIDDRQGALEAAYVATKWAGIDDKPKSHKIRERVEMILDMKDEYKGLGVLEKYGL